MSVHVAILRRVKIVQEAAFKQAKDNFYASSDFAAWEERLKPFVEGLGERKALHGLEAWFRGPTHSPPPRWKMALVSWTGVWPTVFTVSWLLGAYLKRLPMFLAVGITTFVVVLMLTWVVMPRLTRWFVPWLQRH